MILNVAKDFRVDLAVYDNTLAIPPVAMEACLTGSHKPVNPHRQRLLVAAHKATRALPKAKCKARKRGSKAIKKKEEPSPRAAKSENPGCAIKQESSSDLGCKPEQEVKAEPVDGKPDLGTKPKKKHADTNYNIERKKFFAEFLGLNKL